jgi:hypothetical protein
MNSGERANSVFSVFILLHSYRQGAQSSFASLWGGISDPSHPEKVSHAMYLLWKL